jgi:hypothetical protein
MRSTSILGVLVCVSVMAGGCGGPSPTKELIGGTGVAEKGRSACELITDDEASDIVGSPVFPTEKSRGQTSSTCFFAPAPGRGQEFQLTVRWAGGRAAWEANEKAAAFSGQLVGANRSEASANVMKFEEGSLGDRSSYNPVLGAYVLKGDVLLEFNNLLTVSDARAKWEKLARTALSRL